MTTAELVAERVGNFIAGGFRNPGMLLRSPKSSPAKLPMGSSAVVAYSGDRGRVGKANVRMFRNWAEHSEWVRAAINVRRDQVSQAEWDIIALDPDRPYSKPLQSQIRAVLAKPNPREKTFRKWISMVLEDVLVLDAGCTEKVRNLRDQVAELWPVDGGTVKVSSSWDGGDLEEARFFWYPDYRERARWRDDEFIYTMSNDATYRVVGLSPLETLKLAIDSELGASSYNDRQLRAAAPDGMLSLGEQARPDQVDSFKAFWAAEVEGRGSMAIVGGSKNPAFIPFKQSNRDAQFLEWQVYLVRKICAVFKISPQDLGLSFDVNRSQGEVQQENTEDRGIRPLLGLIQDDITGAVVHDPQFGGPDNNLAFAFTALNLNESESRARINKLSLAGMPWKSVNEARRHDGMEPYPEPIYDRPMAMTPRGIVLIEDVPTARETLEGQSSTPPEPGAGGSTPPSRAPAKTEPQPPAAGSSKEL